jgi:L-lactate utilization protein LutB
MDFNTIANDEALNKTVEALKANGVNAIIVETGEEAKQKALELVPKGSEVMTMTSVTLDTIGIANVINESGDYDSVRNKLIKLDRATQSREMQKLGAAPEWTIGSVHAVTEDGKVVVASNTGSQLAAYTYGSENVIWVVGAQKIVKNLDDAMKRIYDYVLPQESVRLNKAFNISTGSYVSKLFILNREFNPKRITLILVKEKLGF